MSVSVNGGDFRFPASPNSSAVRIRVGFTDCGEEGGTAGSATSQPSVLPFSIVFGFPESVVPENPADFCGLGVNFCAMFKQSGTAFASASVHERNRPFT